MANDKLTEMFEEYLQIYKFVNRKAIIDMLGKELNTQRLLKIYELTNGQNSTREIAQAVGDKSHNTIAVLWKRWALQGIVAPTAIKGRQKAAFSLVEYGISTMPDDE